jgi:multisubunit Na+/H+ antiporter MnhB subunit
MPLVKIAASLLLAVLAAYLVGFETIYLGSRALDRACRTPSESCALSSPFVAFFGLVTGGETFVGMLGAGSLRLTGRKGAAWTVVGALAVALVAEHVWLLS